MNYQPFGEFSYPSVYYVAFYVLERAERVNKQRRCVPSWAAYLDLALRNIKRTTFSR